MSRLFFAAAATALRFLSWWPFGWVARQISNAARWCEARAWGSATIRGPP